MIKYNYLKNKGYSMEIDLWALGCMIYEFFTVRVPYGIL